mmetsp:Transcript_14660/g.41224  ORF Transcript_14660/g.41224 Transcript_14660/m.41224 type:complete len:249 (+) Transcript_14660:540-1286(+)
MPSDIQYSRGEMPAMFLCLLANTWVTKAAEFFAKHRPGSPITLMPSSTGKSASTVAVMTSGKPLNPMAPVSASTWHVIPPPMSSRETWNPRFCAASITNRAFLMAVSKAIGSLAPLPTWNDTPVMRRPRFTAVLSNSGTSSSSAPYLFPSVQDADLSSDRMRRTRLSFGATAAIFNSSPTESNVAGMPRSSAKRRSRGNLAGLANIMRDGHTPSCRTACSSLLEAQSKPAPRSARVASMPGSGLHLTA